MAIPTRQKACRYSAFVYNAIIARTDVRSEKIVLLFQAVHPVNSFNELFSFDTCSLYIGVRGIITCSYTGNKVEPCAGIRGS